MKLFNNYYNSKSSKEQYARKEFVQLI